jgi:glycerol-3-phosphate dehydrogenase
VKAAGANTSALSRDHLVRVEAPGLVTITGGKWTTYRRMAEDVVTRSADLAGLPRRPCPTAHLPIHDDAWERAKFAGAEPEFDEGLSPTLPYRAADVVWAARHEMARTVEDVLARRTRAAYLDAAAAVGAAPRVAEILARELDRDADWAAGQVRAFAAAARP